MTIKRDNIDSYYRPGEGYFQSLSLDVDQFGLPYLSIWDPLEDQRLEMYLDHETVSVLVSDQFLVSNTIVHHFWEQLLTDLSLDDEDLYFRVGSFVIALRNEGITIVYLRGRKVSLDRMVQL